MILEDTLAKIMGLDEDAQKAAQARLDSLTKPLGSLGRLEDIVRQVAGITGQARPQIDKKAIVIMCADNGVTDEGVSSCPKSVTASVTKNFTRGITGVCVLGKNAGADIHVVDIGVDADFADAGIIDRKIRRGTWNIAMGPAMTREEAVRAIETGIESVDDLVRKGVQLFGTGEMGIGNTTTSSAVAAVITGRPVQEMVGRGSGLTDEGLLHKTEVIRRAITINKPDVNDPIDVLSKLGGFDIAGLTGCFLGAAALRKPILIDGFIASVAALIAYRLKPEARDFMIASHGSAEPGSRAVLDVMGLEPLLMLGMRLGEGTGAALAFHIIDAAFAAYDRMGTFDDARIEQYKPLV
ncbi:MAG TPA: nicotinate-nucleotide--dimethylbenzimidazole phosphoribosyltransferase [Clostridia bacterium]|nr:nicotinate-nucleotide--dimethylbenzimidazole phosphoribosyltransferase [Clostridia bacterium]